MDDNPGIKIGAIRTVGIMPDRKNSTHQNQYAAGGISPKPKNTLIAISVATGFKRYPIEQDEPHTRGSPFCLNTIHYLEN